MVKSETIHMRVEPGIKRDAENILSQLGLSTTDAINVFLNQVILRGGLPFEVRIPAFGGIKAMQEAQKTVAGTIYPEEDILADIMALRYGKE